MIKVESATRLDTARGLPPFWQHQHGANRSGYFNQYSTGKRSITLNLKSPEAVQIAYELIANADVVVDNFSAGTMERMGFGYERLRALNPGVIQISMAAHGRTGPTSQYIAYGPTQAPMIGLMSVTGYPGGGPREVGFSYGDPNGGINAALAVLAALYHRRRTGEGQYIDMSQWEAAIPLVTEALLAYQMNRAQPQRLGNRDEFEAPQGVFKCAGEDQWIAVSCWSDSEWRALAEVIGRPDLRDDPHLSNRDKRKECEAELEVIIAGWAAERTRDAATAALQAAGVAAFPVYTSADVAADPELAARSFWVELRHAECGDVPHAGMPWIFSGTRLTIGSAAPSLGQHTNEILRDLLGHSAERIQSFRNAGVLD